MDSQTEEFLDWTNSFVYSFINVNFEDISRLRSTVYEIVTEVNSCTGEFPFDVSEVSVQRKDLK